MFPRKWSGVNVSSCFFAFAEELVLVAQTRVSNLIDTQINEGQSSSNQRDTALKAFGAVLKPRASAPQRSVPGWHRSASIWRDHSLKQPDPADHRFSGQSSDLSWCRGPWSQLEPYFCYTARG